MIDPTDEQIKAFKMALLYEVEGASMLVWDFIKDGDAIDRASMGLPPSSGTSLLANDEMFEWQNAVVRAGLRAALNCQR